MKHRRLGKKPSKNRSNTMTIVILAGITVIMVTVGGLLIHSIYQLGETIKRYQKERR